MRRYRLLAALVGILAVAAAIPFAVRQAVDSSWGRRQICQAVAQALGRDLRINGPLQLDWRPYPVLTTGPLSLSNRGGHGQLAAASHLVIGIRTTALLAGHLQISRIEADRLVIHLTRDAAGHTNIDDLLAARSQGSWLRVRPRVIVLRNAQLTVDDALRKVHALVGPVSVKVDNLRPGAFGHIEAATRIRVTGAQSGTGDLHLAATVVPSEHAAGARIDQSNLNMDWQTAAARHLQLHLVAIGPVGWTAGTLLLPGLTAHLEDVSGAARTRIAAHFDGGRWTQGAAQMGQVTVDVDRTTSTGHQQLSFAQDADAAPAGWQTPRPFRLEVTAAGLAQSLSGQWQWTRDRQIALSDLQGRLRWRDQPLAWQGTARLDPLARTALAQVNGTLGTAHFNGQVAVAAAPAQVRASLVFDRLDLDTLTSAHARPAPADARPAGCDVLGGRIQVGQLIWHGWTARQAVLDLAPVACGRGTTHG